MAKIIINTEACKGCGLCTLACPKKILAISAHSNNKGYYYVEVTDKENARVVLRARSLVPTSL